MSDMAYIMETQDPRELWLVEGENKFKVSSDMYWLLASKGADLPPTHHITELLAENAKLHDEVERLRSVISDGADNAREVLAENAKLHELAAGMYGLLAMFDKMFGNHDMCETPRPLIFGEDKSFKDVMRELGIEVPK